MRRRPASIIAWLFSSNDGARGCLLARWIFLRGLGLIYFSAFYSLVFQIKGLIGPDGILPADEYLKALAKLGAVRFWYAPTLLWFSSSSHMLMAICWIGMVASVLVVLNIWPRVSLAVCFVCFLSFVSAAQDFSGYQSDGMLLEAGFLSLFFAPAGLRPGLGQNSRPIRASLFLLQWEWFRIYFESGLVKLASGETQWRDFTAMDEYYQNGPLPTWIGWYVQHLPHWFHAFATGATLGLELGLVWMLFLPRRWRIACFFVVTLWQIPVILTANYTFLNYLVLLLGVLLLDDRFLTRWLPRMDAATHWRADSVPHDGNRCRACPANAERREPAMAGGQTSDHERDSDLDFLCHDGSNVLDSRPAGSVSGFAGDSVGTVSNRKPLRFVRGDDSWPLRNRVPGIE